MGHFHGVGEETGHRKNKMKIAVCVFNREKVFQWRIPILRDSKLRYLGCQAAIKNIIMYIPIYPQEYILGH